MSTLKIRTDLQTGRTFKNVQELIEGYKARLSSTLFYDKECRLFIISYNATTDTYNFILGEMGLYMCSYSSEGKPTGKNQALYTNVMWPITAAPEGTSITITQN